MVKQKKKLYKKRNTWIAITIGGLVLVWVIFRVLFPVFKIDSGLEDDFAMRTINEKKYLELKIKGGHSFHIVKMKVDKQNFFGKIYQDELGLYAEGEIIDKEEQLEKFLKVDKIKVNVKNGELIRKGNFVYFISDGKYRAFANAETFDILGFNWDRVQRDKSDLLSNLTKGEIIDKTISYLPGSFVEIKGKIYLIGLEKKYLVDNKELADYIKDKFGTIEIDNRKLQTVGKVKCKEERRDKMVCKFKDDFKKVLPRATIFIELDGDLKTKWTSKIYTFDGFKSLVPKRTLGNIKRNLVLRYDERLGINNNQ